MRTIKFLCHILYFVVLFLGVKAAYEQNLILAVFWVIIFASENIGISIDRIGDIIERKKI